MVTQRTRIQNKIMDLARAATFLPVSYDRNGNASVGGTGVKPATVLANEVQSTFARDPDQGRRIAGKRTSWAFRLILRFNTEVSLEAFESSLIEQAESLPPSGDMKGVILELITTEASHPVQQQPNTGTEATFFFVATESRR